MCLDALNEPVVLLLVSIILGRERMKNDQMMSFRYFDGSYK